MKKRMEDHTDVYYISHLYDSFKTGGERYNFEVVKYLQKEGHNVKILIDEEMPKFTRGRRFICYNLWYILKFLDSDKFILLTTNYMHPRLILFFLFLKFFKKVKTFVIVYHLRHHEIENKILKALDLFLEKIFLKCSDVIITISKNTMSKVKSLIKKNRNIYVINPAIDFLLPEPSQKKESCPFNILFIGDCVRRKGLEYLIKAFAYLAKEDIHLHIAGNTKKSPQYFAHISQLIEVNNIQNKVTFHGRVDAETKRTLLSSSHLFVLPSLWEGYGIVIAEAMCMGLPLVATKVGAIPELVKNGVNGLLVPPAEEIPLSKALLFMMKNPEVRRKYGENSLNLARKFSTWEKVGSRFLKIFQDSIEEFSPSRRVHTRRRSGSIGGSTNRLS